MIKSVVPEYSIRIAERRHFKSAELRDLYKFRAEIFHQRLGWDLRLQSGMEIDGYDALDPVYLVMRDGAGEICGCIRMLPTTGPYMLKNVFPTLLRDVEAPASASVLELSRFAVRSECRCASRLSDLTLVLIRNALSYGEARGIEYYLTVTTLSVERLLVRGGLVMRRLGRPGKLGNGFAVALVIDIDQSRRALQKGAGIRPFEPEGEVMPSGFRCMVRDGPDCPQTSGT